MPIQATSPTTVPASAAKIYDKWWLSLHIAGNQKPRAMITLKKYRTLDNGSNEFSPVDKPISFAIADVLTVAASRAASNKPALSNAMTALYGAVQEIAGEKQLI